MLRRIPKGFVIYAVVVLLFASYRAGDVHSEPIDCADSEGHGPDPGTRECLGAEAWERENRPEHTRGAFLGGIILGGLGLGVYGSLGLMMRNKYVRLVVNGERFEQRPPIDPPPSGSD